MKKIVVRLTLLACIMGYTQVNATSQFRSPVSLDYGFMHYPLPDLNWTPWYEDLYGDCCDKNPCWYSYQWSGAYWRQASSAFYDPCNPCHDKSTSKTTGLSQLFFGSTAFLGEQAFPGGTINNLCLTPSCASLFLGFARISPQFTYDEKGFDWGWRAERRFGCCMEWRVGGHISLPFKVIDVRPSNACGIEETLNDVVAEFPLNFDAEAAADQVDFAYRLDFLTSAVCLPAILPPAAPGLPGVKYGNGSGTAAGHTEILGSYADGTSATGFVDADRNEAFPPVYVTTSASGTIPCQPFCRVPSQVSGSLGGNGAVGAADGTVLFFDTATNYAGLAGNKAAQAQLFVTPRCGEDGVGLEFQNTNDIRQRVKTVLNIIGTGEETAVEFFARNCINFCTGERIVGLGNLDIDLYAGYGHYDVCEWYTLLHFGAKFPTDKRQEDGRRIFFQSTGNNGHYEARVTGEVGWWPIEWFAMNFDAAYNHVFSRREFAAAPFAGATIINIGPSIPIQRQWSYVTAHANFNFFHPCTTDLGGVISYELFAKQRDRVKSCELSAADLLGNNALLNPCLLEANTKSMTHKIRGEVFSRINFFELFVGGSHIVGGRNAMQETEAHLGVAIWF